MCSTWLVTSRGSAPPPRLVKTYGLPAHTHHAAASRGIWGTAVLESCKRCTLSFSLLPEVFPPGLTRLPERPEVDVLLSSLSALSGTWFLLKPRAPGIVADAVMCLDLCLHGFTHNASQTTRTHLYLRQYLKDSSQKKSMCFHLTTSSEHTWTFKASMNPSKIQLYFSLTAVKSTNAFKKGSDINKNFLKTPKNYFLSKKKWRRIMPKPEIIKGGYKWLIKKLLNNRSSRNFYDFTDENSAVFDCRQVLGGDSLCLSAAHWTHFFILFLNRCTVAPSACACSQAQNKTKRKSVCTLNSTSFDTGSFLS